MATKSTRLGGPLLGNRTPYVRAQKKHDPSSWLVQEPLLYLKGDEHFLIMPNTTFVAVMAYATGKEVVTFVPQLHNEMGQVTVESVALGKFPRKSRSLEDVLAVDDDQSQAEEDDNVLLVGCNDGTIREFCLADITNGNSTEEYGGSTTFLGRVCCPRRVITMKRDRFPIRHLTAPMGVTTGVLIYSLIEIHVSDAIVKQEFCRVILPPIDGVSKEVDLVKQVEKIEKYNCHLERSEKKGVFENTVPFRLLSTTQRVKKGFASDDDQDREIFCVVARCNEFKVYHERIQVNDAGAMVSNRSPVLQFNAPAPLSAVTISPNGADLACGYWEGEIRIYSDAFPTILKYFQNLDRKGKKGPPHPSSSILVRRLHWHAHPVSSLSYHEAEGVDPILYSAGEESVLAIWQLARGTHRPADTLPRLAKGGIAHVLAAGKASTPGIIIFSTDNTLQLVQAHNLKRVWKVTGLASCGDETMLWMDGQRIVMSGLRGAPGYLHWFNPRSQNVEEMIEVAPHNRVSRTDLEDTLMPHPLISSLAFSADFANMVSVETVPTENTSIGKRKSLRNGSIIGNVNTLKFWAKVPKPGHASYVMNASMTFPHGERNEVTAVAMSRDGQYVCTVSNDDLAFRVWRKTLDEDREEEEKNRRRPIWTCLYKITTPSGLANYKTPRNGVSFSTDGSTLCIVYGFMMALWDFKEATLLNSIRHDGNEPIEHMEFVKSDMLHDSILTVSKTRVQMQSPYGAHKSEIGWSCGLPGDGKAIVTQAHAINGEQVAISISFPADRKAKVLYVRTTTGEPIDAPQFTVEVPFKIKRMILAGPRHKRKSLFVKIGEEPLKNEEPPIRFFALSATGELFLVHSQDDTFLLETTGRSKTSIDTNPVPRIHMPPKRKRSIADDEYPSGEENDEIPIKRTAIRAFLGEEDSAPLASSELPFLSGNFMRAFVGRKLSKRRDEENS